MAGKSSAQWGRLVGWLKMGGFLQSATGLTNSTETITDYVYGPAGTLLRYNIKQSWWKRMVVSQESVFPVEGHSLKDPIGCFHEASDLMGQKLPFSLSQELNVRRKAVLEQHADKVFFNAKRQTQFKFVHFCLPSVVNQSYDQLINTRLRWWKQYIGNPSSIQLTGIEDNNIVAGSHIQFQFPWGLETIEMVNNRGDKPVKEREENSGKSYQVECSCALDIHGSVCTTGHLKYICPACFHYFQKTGCPSHNFSVCRNSKKLIHPHQVECSCTLETAMAVFLLDAYIEKLSKGKKKEPREILQLHPGLAPFKVSVIASGSKGRELGEIATYISRELRASGIKLLDTRDATDTLEKNLIRNDKLGVPFTVIVNDSTLETGAISLRNRDTTIRETLAINRLQEYIQKHIAS